MALPHASQQTEEEIPPPPPAPIHKLPTDVINRIAAGEVVVSPSAALKELLENCIDAGATNVTVSVRGGGAKLLQVTDNGSGIAESDLGLLCARHATSKLSTFEDLATVETFGFRGEALASISHVARVSVLTKTPESNHAYTAKYSDGELVSPPSAAAGVDGTTLTVADLFYNLPTRARALRSASEEYRAIVDVVSRYSIRYPSIAFVCKRLPDGASRATPPDVRTKANSDVAANIRGAFGAGVARELIEFTATLEELGITVKGHSSSPSFSLKKGIFVLFINGRLVNCGPLKRAVDAAYSVVLPKGGHAFTYLDITMRQRDIDVNVHPNKMEVRFLNESEIIEATVARLEHQLRVDGKSRTFVAQALLSDAGPAALKRDVVTPGIVPTSAGAEVFPTRPNDSSEGPDNAFEMKPTLSGKASSKRGSQDRDVAKSSKRLRVIDARSMIDDQAIVGNAQCKEMSVNDIDGDDDIRASDDSFIDDSSVREEGSDRGSAGSSLHIGAIHASESTRGEETREKAVEVSDDEDGRRIVATTSTAGDDDMNDSDDEDARDAGAEIADCVGTENRSGPGSPSNGSAGQKAAPKAAPKDKIRTNRGAPVGSMDAFIARENGLPLVAVDLRKRRRRRPNAPPMLSSIDELIAELRDNVHRGAAEILKDHVFVGIASEKYSLIQHQTKLMLVQVEPVFVELMYRQVLMRFSDLDYLELEPPADLVPLVALADDETSDGNRCEECVRLLLDKAPLLEEYFSIAISGSSVAEARLTQLPVLFAGISPDLQKLPEFLCALLDVNWSEEKSCLGGIARLLAEFYGSSWQPDMTVGEEHEAVRDEGSKDDIDKEASQVKERREWLIRHVLFESLRFDFDPPPSLAAALREITSTQKLYKVFERC